jgi:hypothetical protein
VAASIVIVNIDIVWIDTAADVYMLRLRIVIYRGAFSSR